MIRRPPRSTPLYSSAASDVYKRQDLVIVAVDNQRRHVELLEVVGEISFGERLDAVEGVFVTGHYSLVPERVDHALRDLGTGPVSAEERAAGEILVELRAVGEGALANLIKLLNRQAARIGRRFQHQRRD